MARIVITIQDAPGGKVEITSNPNFETMAKMVRAGETMTAAHGYAFAMLNAARRESKSNEPDTKIWIPKVRQ